MMSLPALQETVLDRIGDAQIIPVLRSKSAQEAYDFGLRALRLGLTAIELTATTPGWTSALDSLRREAPDALVGVGTIVTAEAAERAVSGGAQFLVSPYPSAAVREVAKHHGILFIEGGFSTGELADASSRGIAKLFPAHVGGPAYLRSVLSVLPGAKIIPTGGIPLSDVPLWLDAGAFAVGVGSDLQSAADVDTVIAELLGRLRSARR